ncbi:MAG: DNA-directed RNA polymerase subunit N [Candidatus Nitrosocaldus sp.]
MLIPVRCFTCGNLIADKYNIYVNRVRMGEKPANVLDDMGVKRYCCRRMFLSTVETINQLLPYYEVLMRKKEEMESS